MATASEELPVPAIAYGDDRDAPTPEIVLAADLPADPPADDPDPVSAQLDEIEPRRGAVVNVVGIKFAAAGRIYEFDAGDLVLSRGDSAMVDTDRGPRLATVAVTAIRQPHAAGPLKRVLRRPTGNDLRTAERGEERAADALRRARAYAHDHRLSVKIYRAEWGAGGGKVTLFFSSDDRVEFRDLVRDLSAALHARVDMRQTGVRDEAKMVGGIGSCGLELCCSTFLPSFAPVSIKMAKDQGLVLNPTKVNGQCGRLKCCLVYEHATYAEMRKGLPKVGKRVITETGEGRVVEVDVLRQRIRVAFGPGESETFPAGAVRPMFPSGGHEPPEPPEPPEPEPEPDPDPQIN